MNIALFTESYKPYISGVTISVDTLAKELRRLGHKVYIFAPSYKEAKKNEEDVFRFPSYPTLYPGFRVAFPFSRKIQKQIPKLNIDIIHSHSPFQLGLLGKRIAEKMKIPFVYTFHTLFDQYLHYIPLIPKEISKNIIAGHLRRFCNASDAVVVPSIPVKNILKKEGIKSDIKVVPTGIDIEAAKSFTGKHIRKLHNIPKNSILLLYVGRLTKEKNLPFLLKAFQIIKKTSPSAYLMLVARGPKEKKLKSFAKELGISESVKFVGQIKYPAVFDYYAASDIFVFTSTTETQGLVIAEAFTAGLPVVALDAAGVSDAIVDEKHGYLVPHNEIVFSKKVISLIKNEDKRKKMSKEAAKHAERNFSSGAYAEKILKIYSDLLP